MKRPRGALRAGLSFGDSEFHAALAVGANLARVAFFLIAAAAGAQTLEVVHSFSAAAGAPVSRVVLAPDGSFYGTTSYGGIFGKGSIFRLVPDPPNGYTLIEIHSFYGPDGWGPRAGLVLFGDGYMYGTTSGGGATGGGTLFRTDLSGNVTVLHDIDLPEGVIPTTELVAPGDGFLYGTTTVGGPDGPTGGGTIFRSDTAGHVVVLHQFPLLFGFNEAASLSVGPAHTVYGTHAADADHPEGSAFRLEPDGTLTTLHAFTTTDGKLPRGSLLAASDGFFYGTTTAGGADDRGSLFRIDASGGFSIVHEFGPGNGGAVGQLVEVSPGSFLGVAGSVFLAGSDGSFANIHSFTDGNSSPSAGFARGNDGYYYSTTSEGSSGTFGSVYRIDPAGNFLEAASFTNAGGTHPQAGVLEASDGKLYGTTAEAGAHALGAVYRIDATDFFSVIHGFSHDEGGSPNASLVQGPDGALYGANVAAGLSDAGSLVRIDPATQVLTVLHSFVGTDGQAPAARLLPIGGLLYGSTLGGGTAASGTLFRVDPFGTLDTLWEFGATQSGYTKVPLVLGSDGLLYGVDGYSLFRYDDINGVENLHTFQKSDGVGPSALSERVPGIFLGTNESAGEHAGGTLFQSDALGTITVLHAFDGADGAAPHGPLASATDGNIYGATQLGGDNNLGVVYRLSGDDVFQAVHHFDGTGGANPAGGLHQAADGNLYGTTYAGGAAGNGTVYRILLSAANPVVTTIEPSSGLAIGGASVIVRGLHFQPGLTLSAGDVTVPSAVGIDSRTVVARMPPLPPGTSNDLVLTNPDATAATLPGAWFADFLDADASNSFHEAIEQVARHGITAGCGGGNYCGLAPVSRAQMAVFLLKAKHGSDFVPPACTGIFDDVACPGGFAVDWIEDLSLEGITGGCGGANYCPDDAVRRDQMAVFLLKASQGSSYVPPAATGMIFTDVPTSAFAADWIEDLYSRNVTGGCLTNPLRYCPSNTNNRQQMAVFITKTFGLQ